MITDGVTGTTVKKEEKKEKKLQPAASFGAVHVYARDLEPFS